MVWLPCSSDPSINGHLHYPNDVDRSLNEDAVDKSLNEDAVDKLENIEMTIITIHLMLSPS